MDSYNDRVTPAMRPLLEPLRSRGVVRIGVVIVIVTGLALATTHEYENWGDDWAQYVLQAHAILDGRMAEYLDQNAFMVNQSSGTVGPVGYPWGLPLLLAAEVRLFGANLLTFKLFNIVFLAAIVALTAVYANRLGSAGSGVAAAALVGFNPAWVNFVNRVLSELPFTAVGMCWLIAATTEPSRDRRLPRSMLMGALSFAAFTIRVNGVLLLVAGVLDVALNRSTTWRRRVQLAAVDVLTFAALWAAWSWVFPDGSASYTRQLQATSVANIVRDLIELPTALFSFFTAGRLGAAAWCFVPFAVIGAFSAWRDARAAVLYCTLTIGLYAIWPAGQPFRFMMPLMPIIGVFVVLGLQRASEMTTPAWARVLQGVLMLIPATFLAVSLVFATRAGSREAWHPYDAASSEVFAWIRQNTAPDAVIAFFKPRVMHLLGERLSITAMSDDAPRATYLVYGKRPEWTEFQDELGNYDQFVTLVPRFENQNFIVFAVVARPAP